MSIALTHSLIAVVAIAQLLNLPLCIPFVQVEFWKALSQPHPSLSVLDTIGTQFELCVNTVEHSFRQMMHLNPSSTLALRSYAQFLIEVRAPYTSPVVTTPF